MSNANTEKYFYGLDAEIQAKLGAKFSPEKMNAAQVWTRIAWSGLVWEGGNEEAETAAQ